MGRNIHLEMSIVSTAFPLTCNSLGNLIVPSFPLSTIKSKTLRRNLGALLYFPKLTRYMDT